MASPVAGVHTIGLEERLIDRLKERSKVIIDRPTPSARERHSDVALFAGHVRHSLETQVDDIRLVDQAVGGSESPAYGRDFGNLKTEAGLHAHLIERLEGALNQPLPILNYTIAGGTSFLAPPYDEEWQTGAGGLAFGARVDGSPITISADGYSAAAVGFYVSSSDTLLAAVTPQGHYDFNWFSFESLPALHSRGGMGITVYADGNPQPVTSRLATLWNVKGVNAFSADKGSGPIANAASPAWGFGPVPIAPAYLNLTPTTRFLVWVWCWQVKQFAPPSGGGFLAFMRFTMPFVTVSAGPPIIIK